MDDKEFNLKVEQSKITAHLPRDPRYWPKDVPSSVTKKWFFDVQWSDCPEFIEAEVIELWKDFQLGNDNFIKVYTVDDPMWSEDYPLINQWLKYKGVSSNEDVIVHWWW